MAKIFRTMTLLIFLLAWCSADARILSFNANENPVSVAFDQVDAGQVDLAFDINEIILNEIEINNKTYIKPGIPGESRLQQEGHPDLPIISRSVQIPSEGEVSFGYQVVEYKDIPNAFVVPSKGHISRSQRPSDIPYSFGSIYHQQEAWPEEAVTTSAPYFIRNCRGVTVRLCPFQYFPDTETLRIFLRVEVQVYCKNTTNLNLLSLSGNRVSDPVAFQKIYAGRFINYKNVTESVSIRTDASVTRPGRMLIIAADHLTDAVEPLAVWKRQMGIPTNIVPLSAIGSTAADIKAYVQSAYDEGNLAYLLLVGDAEDIPSPIIDCSGYIGASDPSYGKLEGADDYPDILVGRFSGSTQAQISTMVERTIQYEKSPDLSSSWYDLATGIASDEGSDPSDIEHMDALRTKLLENGYAAIDQLYDPGASALQLTTAVNEGRGLINYVGHGDTAEWSTTGFTNAHVNALTNTFAWPFIFDVACLNGKFDGQTCFAEAWLRAEHESTPAGALAIYASTISQVWEPPMTAQNEFNRLLVSGDVTRFGALCFNGSMEMMADWGETGTEMFDTWTVFGDPSVQVRTKTACHAFRRPSRDS